jgi:uncharacterized protein YlxW (UPF0749 family)
MTSTGPTTRRGRPYSTDLLDALFRESLDAGYAASAAAAKRSPAKKRFYRGLSALAALVLGFLLAVAYQKVVQEEPQRQSAREGLITEVHTRQDRIDTLQGREELLRGQVNSLQAALLNDGTLEQLRVYEAATGLRKVTGDGVVVTLEDAPQTPDAFGNPPPKDSRVLYLDLRTVVNQLWADGAEAISVNGQRLTSVSTIRSAGEAILVDFKPLITPYKVAAIGPGSMADDFNASPTAALFRDLVKSKGMGFAVKPTGDLSLPAAANPQLHYAKPLVSSSPSTPKATSAPSPSPTGGGK